MNKEKELLKKYDDLEKTYLEERKLWNRTKMTLEDKVDDLTHQYERRVKELKNEIEDLKGQLKIVNSDNFEKLKKENDDLKIKIKENNTDNLKFKVLELEKLIENYTKEIKYKDSLIDRYQELPDIKKMLENLSSLKVPALDDLKKFFEIFKSDEIVKKIDRLSQMIESDLKRHSDFFRKF